MVAYCKKKMKFTLNFSFEIFRNANGSTPLDLAAFKTNEMKEALETPLANTQADRTATVCTVQLFKQKKFLFKA